uniref:F-box domain-containing protein n=1 Tax=Steinernema glaseri TaxID=37863 RepID=A0A1I8ATC2_9BILA
MDAVPWKFVDSVIELFGRETLEGLAREVRHRHWKDVVDLHHRNRVYYTVNFRKDEGGIRHIFLNGYKVDLSINTRTIRENRRFMRIMGINDLTTAHRDLLSYFDEILEENWPQSTLDLLTKFLLRGRPGKRVDVSLPCALHLNNNYIENLLDLWKANGNLHFMLHSAESTEDKKRLRALVSKGKVPRYLTSETFFKHDTEKSVAILSEHLLDLWRSNGTVQFELYCFDRIADKEGLLAVINKGKVKQEGYKLRSTFKHDTEKSVAVLSNNGHLIRCYTCECDKFQKCQLKNDHPELHDF